MTVRFFQNFNLLKPRRGAGASWAPTDLAEALQQIGGSDALVAWDRDVTQPPVLNRTWATTHAGGGRVWVSKTARSPVPVDLRCVWEYSRLTDTAPIGSWSSTSYLTMLLNQVVFDVGVPTRARTPLWDNNILFVGELVKYAPDELLAMRNLGNVTFHGIQRSLAKHGLELSMDVGSWVPPPTSLTLPEPPPGPYDVTLDCEVFDFVRTCSWHPRQYRLVRFDEPQPDLMQGDVFRYAFAYRERRFTRDWNACRTWDELLRYINFGRVRNVHNLTNSPEPLRFEDEEAFTVTSDEDGG